MIDYKLKAESYKQSLVKLYFLVGLNQFMKNDFIENENYKYFIWALFKNFIGILVCKSLFYIVFFKISIS
jgi:hypothetical protein